MAGCRDAVGLFRRARHLAPWFDTARYPNRPTSAPPALPAPASPAAALRTSPPPGLTRPAARRGALPSAPAAHAAASAEHAAADIADVDAFRAEALEPVGAETAMARPAPPAEAA